MGLGPAAYGVCAQAHRLTTRRFASHHQTRKIESRQGAMSTKHVMKLRVSERERLAIQHAAATAGLGVSEFLRRCALGRTLLVDDDLGTIGVFREIAQALRIGVESEVVIERIRSEIEARATRIECKRQEKTG